MQAYMASKKFPLLIFIFVLLIVIAGIATLVFHRAQKKEEMMYQQNAQATPTNSSKSTSNAQLDQDSQNVDNSLNSVNQDLNNVDSSMNDQSTNLQ